MSKRINISIDDDLFEKLSELKDEFRISGNENNKINRSISNICQEALRKVIKEAEVSRIYRLEGIKDGKIAAQSLSPKVKKFIFKVREGKGPYKKLSKLDRVEVLNDFLSGQDRELLQPKFKELMDGKIELDKWVESNRQQAEDRRGEMTFSYIEGTYEGVVRAIYKGKKSQT